MPYYKATMGKNSIWGKLPLVTLPNEAHLEDFLAIFPPEAIILDVGSGGRVLSPTVITVDKFITENTRVIGDIHNLPFLDESVDCIISTGTFEHIEDPWLAAKEFYRLLKKGGRVYIGTPFMQGYHPDPKDYWRFTEDGLIKIFGAFVRIDSGTLMGSGSGLSWAINDFFRALSDNHIISELLGVAARFIFFWVKYFDLILKRKRNNGLFASGYYFIGQKL
jgi:SAM-dependent methyltransferase